MPCPLLSLCSVWLILGSFISWCGWNKLLFIVLCTPLVCWPYYGGEMVMWHFSEGSMPWLLNPCQNVSSAACSGMITCDRTVYCHCPLSCVPPLVSVLSLHVSCLQYLHTQLSFHSNKSQVAQCLPKNFLFPQFQDCTSLLTQHSLKCLINL